MAEKQRFNETVLPISWDGDQECLIFYNVEFREAFGPVNKGDKLNIRFTVVEN